jgi:uncharacterized membrane protein SpoIIM required for sporulation
VPPLGISARWIEKRKPYWDRLEALLRTCGRGGVAALAHADLRELALLYRQTASDLSVAREDPTSAALARYLNDLLGRAHNLIYSGAPRRAGGIRDFYLRVFPAVFRETLPYTLAAAGIFAATAIAGVILTLSNPGFERLLLPPEMMDTIERREMWTHSVLAVKPLASSAIMTNNLSVALVMFASGIMAGLGTLYLLAFNGLLIGVIGAVCDRAGMAVSLWSFVAPHGVLELPAIFIAGGAGLLLGRGLVAPGALSRRDALADCASRAIRLLLGVIPLLVVAGVIEAFVSPSDIPVPAKFLVAAALFILMCAYFALPARRLTPDSAP